VASVTDDAPDDGAASKAAVQPPFPRLSGASTSVDIQRDWSARAWAGTPDRLVKIQNETEAALARIYDQEAGKLLGQSGYDAVDLADDLRLRVTATGNAGRLTRTGELGAIFAETDLSDIDIVHLSNRKAAGSHIDLTFRRKPKEGSTAVKLQVGGSDRPWIGGTVELLSSEIAKGVPAWAWLRHGGVATFIGILMALGAGGLLLATVSDDPRDSIFLVLSTGLVVGGFVGAVVIWPTMKHFFPGLDIHEPGGSPVGRRTLAGAVTLLGLTLGVAGVVLGVLAL